MKIAKIEVYRDDSDAPIKGAIVTPAESGYGAFLVDRDYLSKHTPQVGGYFVVYSDGYKSWSPAQAFEEGYTRV